MSPKVISTADKLRLEERGKKQGPTIKSSSSRKNGNGKAASAKNAPPKGVTLSKGNNKNKNNKPATKKRKRSSPFRIKVGCVAALRFLPEDNDVFLVGQNNETPQRLDWGKQSFVHVWTSPLPMRDEGLALIGKRIRCFLPKMQEGQKRRVLEGEVVRLVGYGSAKRARGQNKPIKVDLLVDKNHAEYFPFLPRSDEAVDESKLSETARRNIRLETSIRGQNKVTVRIKLAIPRPGGGKASNGIMWAIQKVVPAKLLHHTVQRKSDHATVKKNADIPDGQSGGEKAHENGGKNGALSGKSEARSLTGKNASDSTSKSTNKGKSSSKHMVTRHIGDGNDSPDQQVGNWRWLASRYHDMLLSTSSPTALDSHGAESLSGGFIGEVLKVDSSTSEPTLAMVTLRRLLLPEHTSQGRLPDHSPFDVFEDHDNCLVSSSPEQQTKFQIQVPIEQLTVISRKLEKTDADSAEAPFVVDGNLDRLAVSQSYSFRKDLYIPLDKTSSLVSVAPAEGVCCHRCRRLLPNGSALTCTSGECPLAVQDSNSPRTSWCQSCIETLDVYREIEQNGVRQSEMPCCLGLCDCRKCISLAGAEAYKDLRVLIADAVTQQSRADSESSFFESAAAVAGSIGTVDFGLPKDFLDLPKPLAQPSTRVKARSSKKAKKRSISQLSISKNTSKARRPCNSPTGLIDKNQTEAKRAGRTTALQSNGRIVSAPVSQEDYSVFKPTCARLLSSDEARQREKITNDLLSSKNSDRPRILRETLLDKRSEPEKEEKASSRAARANQRRLLKDVVAIGASRFGVDTLASREPQLRFDRSNIHAWGVFADEDIAAEEMIIEYRGEIIGNAVAEKREKLYNAAKIGSDYMFRIDALNVCDATKQGNVARFINASCDPNCYTKIITKDGNKRIVIYSKRDISSGEELCYDYKFPLEYDESKRVPCHCGARDCRGFMNWDRRYVTMSSSDAAVPHGQGKPEKPPVKELEEWETGTRHLKCKVAQEQQSDVEEPLNGNAASQIVEKKRPADGDLTDSNSSGPKRIKRYSSSLLS